MKLQRAVNIALHSELPNTWGFQSKADLVALLEAFPHVRQGYPTPYTTFLLFLLSLGDTAAILYPNVAMSAKTQEQFAKFMRASEGAAESLVKADETGFKHEMEHYGDFDTGIVAPHIHISALYRYIMAFQHGMLVLVSTQLLEEAKLQIRKNPYSYFAYGEEEQQNMPIAWEDL